MPIAVPILCFHYFLSSLATIKATLDHYQKKIQTTPVKTSNQNQLKMTATAARVPILVLEVIVSNSQWSSRFTNYILIQYGRLNVKPKAISYDLEINSSLHHKFKLTLLCMGKSCSLLRLHRFGYVQRAWVIFPFWFGAWVIGNLPKSTTTTHVGDWAVAIAFNFPFVNFCTTSL